MTRSIHRLALCWMAVAGLCGSASATPLPAGATQRDCDGAVVRWWSGEPISASKGGGTTEAAITFLREHADQIAPATGVGDLVPVRRASGLATDHVWFQRMLSGLPVEGATIGVHLAAGQVRSVAGSHGPALALVAGKDGALPFARALEAALTHTGAVAPLRAPASGEQVVWASGATGIPAWRIGVPSREPLADFVVWVDGRTGAVLASKDVLQRASGSGRVFDPNPVVTLQNPALTDQNDSEAAVPSGAYFTRTLQRLDGSGNLRGSFVDVYSQPSGAQRSRAFEPSLSFSYGRSDLRFEETMVYFHIDRAQALIQQLGFTNVNNRVQTVNAHAQANDNSFYSPLTKELAFGDGGVDDAEDADVILHEYGHSIQDNQVPGWGGSAESGAMGEGWGDFHAAASLALSLGQTYQLEVVADWDATSYSPDNPPDLRRLDSTKHYPEGLQNEVHKDGEIWSACLWQLRGAVGMQQALRLVLESHFHVPSNGTFADGANAIQQADQALNAGANATAIRQIFINRGILGSAPAVDDHPNSVTGPFGSSDIVTVGGAAGSGTIEVSGDADLFQVSLVAGQTYTFRTTLGTLTDTVLALLNGSGAVLTSNDDDGTLRSSRIASFTATASGTHYLRVTGFGTARGSYTVLAASTGVQVADDHPNTVSSPFGPGDLIAVGDAPAAGTLETAADADLFRASLLAGQSYIFEVTQRTLTGAVIDVLDPAGNALVADGGFVGSLTVRTARYQSAGATQAFLRVRGLAGATGSYTVRVTVDQPQPTGDDHPNTVAGPFGSSDEAVPGGAAVAGEIETNADADLFRVSLGAGLPYTFSVTLGSLRDSVLEVLDGAGAVLATNDDFGGTSASRIEHYRPRESGALYLRVHGYLTNQLGTYTVQVTQESSVPLVDDHPDAVSGPFLARDTLSETGASAPGTLERTGDLDVYRIPVTGGRTYAVRVALGTLRDSVLDLLGPTGTVLRTNDDISRTNFASALGDFVAPSTGYCFARVGAYADRYTGTYSLAFREAATAGLAVSQAAVPAASGIRFVSVPLRPVTPLLIDGRDLLRATGATALARVNQGNFQVVLDSVESTVFPLVPGEGYLLLGPRVPATGPLQLTGSAWTQPTLAVQPGLNLVGFSQVPAGNFDSAWLAEQSGSSFVVSARGTLRVYIPDLSPPFALQPGDGYLLSAGAARALTLPAGF
ncbi:MAG: pre-peptidase C-terminal domain-containing protein [Candidatus Wallbacteria bacterium]|nr:pre-peptidase C-terminal domain-containing protein [Candidatus Wallbacteria bacterium]